MKKGYNYDEAYEYLYKKLSEAHPEYSKQALHIMITSKLLMEYTIKKVVK